MGKKCEHDWGTDGQHGNVFCKKCFINSPDAKDAFLSDHIGLLPCPFCGGSNINDKGYGIQCRTCGVWVGDGSDALKFGGYKKLWNKRGI